ncbi:hypothetical protein [uncultured Desulfobulbus sp.]|uniref:hypothetical protein n=1 Tax=uncultured Desulfobulbus sp. TaxID=239745 RepID=UPI0029C880F0|nr:hypothetical protein [uncultured Desulfobulbus sp.]
MQKFRLITGEQYTYRSPDVHYKEKKKRYPREVNIRKDFTEEHYSFFPFLQLEYYPNQASSWNITYNEDHTDTGALTHERIKFFGFSIKLGLKAPVEIDTQTLKFFYNRALIQNKNFELGGSLGMQILNINADAKIPILGSRSESITVPLPALGMFASYAHSDRLKYRIRTNYFSLGSISFGELSAGGMVAESNFCIEYQYTPTWVIGTGYRYSYLTVKLDQENYSASGSHITHGPTIFLGASF